MYDAVKVMSVRVMPVRDFRYDVRLRHHGVTEGKSQLDHRLLSGVRKTDDTSHHMLSPLKVKTSLTTDFMSIMVTTRGYEDADLKELFCIFHPLAIT